LWIENWRHHYYLKKFNKTNYLQYMTRRNQSFFDDIIEVTTMLPWWIGVLLAVVFYLGLHWYAGTSVPSVVNPKAVSEVIVAPFLRGLAYVGQYLLPFIFLCGSVLSVLKAKKRRTLHDQVAALGSRRSLENISWQEFEQLVGEYFRRKGFSVQESGGGGADGGIDLVASIGKDRYLVQCKQWKARQVGVSVVRELYGVMAAQGAAGGFVVASGTFTEEVLKFAEGREISIVHGDQLIGEISAAGPRVSSESPQKSKIDISACPLCGAIMVKRVARKGVNAGNAFWGCSTYPTCRGTRPA
jgi:restriction system protein